MCRTPSLSEALMIFLGSFIPVFFSILLSSSLSFMTSGDVTAILSSQIMLTHRLFILLR